MYGTAAGGRAIELRRSSWWWWQSAITTIRNAMETIRAGATSSSTWFICSSAAAAAARLSSLWTRHALHTRLTTACISRSILLWPHRPGNISLSVPFSLSPLSRWVVCLFAHGADSAGIFRLTTVLYFFL